jgi:hypothetical protein
MQRIGATSHGLAMEALRLLLVTAPLRLGDPFFEITIVAAAHKPLAVTRYGTVLYAQVDPNGHSARRGLVEFNLHGQAQPPVSHRVLGKTALLPIHPLKPLPFK